MKRLKLYIISLIVTLISVLSACTDDMLYDPDGIGEGFVSLSATVRFEPQASALESRATDGQAMRDINSLTVVLYNINDTETPIVFNLRPDVEFDVRSETTENSLPADYVGTPAESTTATASFTLPDIQVGKYKMYAIANMGNMTAEQVGSEDHLKHINLLWKTDEVASNNQMFGYFTYAQNNQSIGFDAPEVIISKKNTRFHAWLKRAASKVTVVYDGSGLHNDILVYIHKVTIHDLPKSCYLGADNKPNSIDSLITNGESIYYNSAGEQIDEDFAPEYSQYESWMRIGRGSGLKGSVDKDETGKTIVHTEKSKALYFYENLQGNYDKDVQNGDSTYYKGQIWKEVGYIVNSPDQPDYKDNIPYGSYIEVDAFYVSKHAPVISSGKIKYRFMLGLNTNADYNAFRNNHYKLTLKFKGYANQADWHIEYVEDAPEIYVPDKYYVSYIYNDKSMFPVRLTGKCSKLECEIIENNWAPFDSTGVGEVPPAGELGASTGESFQWYHQVWENASHYQEEVKNNAEISAVNGSTGRVANYTYGRHKVRYDKDIKGADTTMYVTPIWAGFLSLTVPSDYENESTHLPTTLFNAQSQFYGNKEDMTALRDYFYAGKNIGEERGGYGSEMNDRPQNIREFDLSVMQSNVAVKKENGRNAYYVTKLDDGTTTLQMPLWTRPQTMIRISGFSGNNPFESYMRKAVVRFRAYFETAAGIQVRVKDVPVYQVRRVVNPKGVWRSWNDNSSFNVTLTQRRDAGADKFNSFKSEGSWRAYIGKNSGKSFFNLSGGVIQKGDTIYGDTDSPITFKINFTNQTAEDETNCAIIEVEYHGFNCRHAIFVRQGFDVPLELVSGYGKWSSYALYAASHEYQKTDGVAKVVLTKSPLALGTFFKRGNLDEGILVKNNDTYGKLQPIGYLNNGSFVEEDLLLADIDATEQSTKKAKWSAIKGIIYTDNDYGVSFGAGSGIKATYSWPEMEVEGDDKWTYTVPTYSQYKILLDYCDCGFGVFYSDGATETAQDINDVFRYEDNENEGKETTHGMRGAIVYNTSNAAQIFFPLGARGVGRRTVRNSKNSNYYGELRYGTQPVVLDEANDGRNPQRPICYNLPANPGALYWLREVGGENSMSWDINYGDLNFSSNDYAAGFWPNGDALPIKLICTEK